MAKKPVMNAPHPSDALEPRIVAATGVSVNSKDKNLAKQIEQAMTDAIKKAAEDGETNPDKIRARMLNARQRVKDELAKRPQ